MISARDASSRPLSNVGRPPTSEPATLDARYSLSVPRSDPRRALVLICAVALAVATNYTNHGPVLGFIGGEFHLDAGSTGAIATAFFLGAATTMLVGGSLADRWGARGPVTAGFLLTCVGTLGCGLLSPTYPVLLAWRFIGGVGGGVAFAAGAAYTRNVFSGRGQHLAQGLYGSAFLAGSALPLVYMALLAGDAGDWRRGYLVSGLVTLGVWAVWWRFAPASPPAATRTTLRSGLGQALRARNSWLLALCHTCGFGLAMVLGTWVVSYLSQGYGVPLILSGLLGSLVLGLGIAGRSGGALALERGVTPVSIIRFGIGLAGAGLVVMALAGSLGAALAGLLAAGVGVGLPYAALFNGSAVSVPESPGSAQAIVGWGGNLTAIVGPPVVGVLLDVSGGFSSGFLLIAAFAAAVLVTTFALRPFSFHARQVSAAEP